ncbi:amidase domain-containing protein, partial [Heyndrickxia coagulans]|uniref:amidase domain-containing protein n=1 Tax=Heyndrickxia coagulans TaxID=1398 RepID=UPI00399CE9D8
PKVFSCVNEPPLQNIIDFRNSNNMIYYSKYLGFLGGDCLRKKGLKIVAVFIAMLISFSAFSLTGAAEGDSSPAQTNGKAVTSSSISYTDLSMGAIQNLLTSFLKSQGIDYSVGSEDYVGYLTDLLMDEEGVFDSLKALPYYEEIRSYAVAYLNELGEAPVEINGSNFVLPDSLLNEKITDVQQEIATQDKVDEAAVDTIVKSASAQTESAAMSSSSSYNPNAARDYAYKWWNKRNPNYQSFSNDCTNFVSQALHAGGYAMKKMLEPPAGRNDNGNYWYNYFGFNKNGRASAWVYTRTWTSVKYFYEPLPKCYIP